MIARAQESAFLKTFVKSTALSAVATVERQFIFFWGGGGGEGGGVYSCGGVYSYIRVLPD